MLKEASNLLYVATQYMRRGKYRSCRCCKRIVMYAVALSDLTIAQRYVNMVLSLLHMCSTSSLSVITNHEMSL